MKLKRRRRGEKKKKWTMTSRDEPPPAEHTISATPGEYTEHHARTHLYTNERIINAVTMNKKKDLFHSTVPNGSWQFPVILPVAVVVVVV